MNTELAAALEAFKPELADRFAAMVRHQFDVLVRRHGPALKNIANTTDYRVWANTVRPLTTCTRTGKAFYDVVYAVDETRLAAEAVKYADEVTAEWGRKIEAKLGEMGGAKVNRMDGCRFLITGTRAGRRVEIQQDMILNVSSKGLLFNQWPARVYIDGKFFSAAAYTKAFA